MGHQDRYYYRDSEREHASHLTWVFAGSMPLFMVGRVRVRAHACLLVFIALVLAFGLGFGPDLPTRAVGIAVLIVSLLLHELGHSAADLSRGNTDESILWPLGGIMRTRLVLLPVPSLLGSLCGPIVSFAIWGVSSSVLAGLWHITRSTDLFAGIAPTFTADFDHPALYVWMLNRVNYYLLVLNLLPILPLDGGFALQAIVWSWLGYARSLLLACHLGMVFAIGLGVAGAVIAPTSWTIALALWCLLFCLQQHWQVKTAGVWSFDEMDEQLAHPPHRRHHLSRFAKWQARRQIRREEKEQVQLDAILQKVHDTGMRSLTWREKRVLKHATLRQREREMENA
jgi:Zn-dependent protease